MCHSRLHRNTPSESLTPKTKNTTTNIIMTETEPNWHLITTQHRGVFAGELKERRDNDKTVVLTSARCAIKFNTTGGFLELADKGPNSGSKIGNPAPEITLLDVTSITLCSAEATDAWKQA